MKLYFCLCCKQNGDLATLCAFPCNLFSALLKNGPVPGSESLTFVSSVLCDQTMGSAVNNAPALEEERAGAMNIPQCLLLLSHYVGIGCTCAVRVNLPQTGSYHLNKCVHGMDAVQIKDQHKPPFSIGI